MVAQITEIKTMDYVGEVAGLFRSRCGDTKILSPMDYVIVAEWEKEEIPLAIVLAAINEICDQLKFDDHLVESIGSFQEAVKQNFRAWLQTEGREQSVA